jgi:hypothetical protein
MFIYFFKNKYIKDIKLIIFFMVVFFYFSNETNLYFNFNKNFFFFKKNLETLSNGLFFIHPILLYISYNFYFYFFILKRVKYPKKMIAVSFFFILSLFLGG